MKTIYISLICLACAGTVPAQQSYTLEQCKQMALENNARTKNSRLGIRSAEQTRKEAFTRYFPAVELAGFSFKAKDPVLSANMGGMPLELLQDGWAGAVTLTQPLFTGGKIVYGNRLAALGVEAGKQQARLSDNEVLLSTEQLYWQLVSLHEKRQTLDALEEQLNTLLKNVEVSHRAGLVTLNDVLQVKLKLNDLKSKRINLDNGIDLAKMALCQKAGISLDAYRTFDIESPEMDEVASPADMYVDHREALSGRAENVLLEQNIQAGRLQTRIKRADYMPTVAVGATYYKQNLIDGWDGNGAVFVSVSIPLSGWWGGSHAIRKQQINEQIAYNNKIDGQEQLLLQMQQVKNELDDAYKQIAIAREAIGQAEENLRLNNDYYKMGMVNLTDVLDAQSFVQQNRDKYADAYTHYRLKTFEYLVVTGR